MAERINWIDRVYPFTELNRIMAYYLDMECWIIPADQLDQWHEMNRHYRASWPITFDFTYGKREARELYNKTQLEKVVSEKKTLCSAHNGISSFFVPVFRKGKVAGILQSGVFLRKVPNRQALLDQWKEMTGAQVVDFNPTFLNYVRSVLDCPLVEGPVYQALRELLELYAGLLGGTVKAKRACGRAAELRLKVFAKHLYHRFWVDVLVKRNRYYAPTWWIGKLSQWEMAEMGAGKIPTVILAAMPAKDSGRQKDGLDLILQNYLFQREMVKFAQSLPGTMARPLEDYGILLFTSPQMDGNPVREKLEILDKVDRLSAFCSKRFSTKVQVGIGRTGPGGDLSGVYQQAVAALGFCEPLATPVLFYEDVRSHPGIQPPKSLYDSTQKLVQSHVQGGDAEGARKEYIERILSRSEGQPENIKVHFFYAFGQIVATLKKRFPLESENLDFLFTKLETQLQEAGNIADTITIFQEALKRIMGMALRPQKTSQSLQLEGARQYIEKNFAKNLKLDEVARANGFSASVFGRGLKSVMGMGFSAYLRKVRLDQAKKLLRSTQLPIQQISLECGFGNLQYFFDLFKRSTGNTPQEFRAKNQIRK